MNSQHKHEAQSETLSQAMDRLWVRFLPDILDRVAVLEAGAKAAAAGTISKNECDAAQAAAHKLAGILGTFYLDSGTDMARDLERSFSVEGGPDRDSGRRFVSITVQLREMVESRLPRG